MAVGGTLYPLGKLLGASGASILRSEAGLSEMMDDLRH